MCTWWWRLYRPRMLCWDPVAGSHRQTGHIGHFGHTLAMDCQSVHCHPCQNSNYKVYGGGHCQRLPYTYIKDRLYFIKINHSFHLFKLFLFFWSIILVHIELECQQKIWLKMSVCTNIFQMWHTISICLLYVSISIFCMFPALSPFLSALLLVYKLYIDCYLLQWWYWYWFSG